MRKVTTVLDVVGVLAVTAGVAMLSLPVGVIVFGVAVLLLSWRVASR